MTDKIRKAYRSSKNIYDDVLTQKSFLSRLYINLIWHGVDDNVIAGKVLSCIPEDFSGSLLDVPVGTAVFTEKKWRSLKHAKITCLDYSQDMLSQAQERLGECGFCYLIWRQWFYHESGYDERACARDVEVSEEEKEEALKAVRQCPVDAISLVEERVVR